MGVSIYHSLVPSFTQLTTAGQALLDKAQNWAAEAGVAASDVIEHRLAPDMQGLPFQICAMKKFSLDAILGAQAGLYKIDLTPAPRDFDGLKAVLQKLSDGLAALDEASMADLGDKDVVFELPDGNRLDFKALDFLYSFAQPNFYFHATTFYDILRNKGLPISKMDYLGAMRLKV